MTAVELAVLHLAKQCAIKLGLETVTQAERQQYERIFDWADAIIERLDDDQSTVH